ncbi:MAG TPA: hypothetical protein VFI91_09830, partial [Longimicrobiaceae bacterium]|nr:hypothetical protein [Longimicrobiaceae bacterium]
YANHPHFQQTTVLSSQPGVGTGGVTEAFKQRVIMPITGAAKETNHVLGHELVHAFQYDISGFGRAGGGLEAAARRFNVPLWFTEGMAEYLSLGPVDPHTAMWLRDAALTGEIPSIERLTYDPRIFPYRYGHALWAYIAGRWGDAVIGQILKLVGQGVPYPDAFERLLNTSLDEISQDWEASIRRTYLPLLADHPEAREIAQPLITSEDEGGSLNVAPSLSPDGQWVAFLSELDFIDVQLHLANAETGEVIRTLQEGSAFDPHFSSLRYISSSGTWSPDGQRFAFSALRGGTDYLVVIDVNEADIIREYKVPGVGEITNPSWSPDGRSIAFSGIVGGISDLYILDLQSGQARQLTDDRYADLQPVYSPDGSRIAFVTDRGPETDVSALDFAPYRIALFDISSGVAQVLPRMEGPNNINPAWTADGAGLYFVSNRSGIPNIYRLDLASEDLFRITDLFGGVSGITDLSPSMTSAATTDKVLFTAFEEGNYNIYSLEGADDLTGELVPVSTTYTWDTDPPLPAVLPPAPRPQEGAFNRVVAMLDNDEFGLPAPNDTSWNVVPYDADLSLDYLGQPQVGVATGGMFGQGGVYGGIAGIFSDMLGRHQVFGAVQAQGQLDEIGFSTIYLNRRGRWNFGVSAQRVPIVYGQYREGFTEDFYVQQIIRARFFNSSLQGLAQYPFSTVQRVEFNAGYRRFATDLQIFEILRDPSTGVVIDQRERDQEGIGLNLFETSAALVYDNALLGYTSPFAGQRYRFEITPTFGDLQFVQALGDYRKYFWWRPFTFAVRGLHFGRYGPNADGVTDEGEDVFNDIYLGAPSLVRGYGNTYSDCRSADTADERQIACETLPQLLGSRIGIASAEIRFPLLQNVVIGSAIGLPPIEGLLFYDAGIAWSNDIDPVFQRGIPRNDTGEPLLSEHGIVTSAGVGARINLFGYIIMEVDYVQAFELDNGWQWIFNFTPGF